MLKMLHSATVLQCFSATVLHSATDKLTTENHDQSDSNDGRLCVLVCWSCKAILIINVNSNSNSNSGSNSNSDSEDDIEGSCAGLLVM